MWATTVEGCYVTGNAVEYEEPKPPEPQPVRVPGDGTFEVGRDIPPGTYRNAGASNDLFCVAHASSKPADLGSYLRGSTWEGPAIIEVHQGEYFTTQFCKPFTLDR